MAKKKTTPTESAGAKIDRARAATERARMRLGGTVEAINPALAPLSWWRERWGDKATRRTFIEKFIHVRDAFDKNKVVLMKFNDFQSDFHRRVTGKDVSVKPRRLGSSMYWIAAFFCDALILSGSHVRIVPHDPDTEEEFFDSLQIMHANLPEHLRVKTTVFTKRLIRFHDPRRGTVNSKIKSSTVQPGFEAKGRGQAITHLLLTEVPHWRGDSKKAATALIEAAAGGQVAEESTPEGIELHHAIYQDGKTGKGGWTSHFYQWWWKREYRIEGARFFKLGDCYFLINPLKPDDKKTREPVSSAERKVCALILLHLLRLGYVPKGTKWHAPAVAEYLAWRRAKIEEIGEKTFLVEYAENDRDCFEQTGRPVVRAEFLKVTCEPAGPVEGRQYLVSVDTSAGTERGNPAAIQVLDIFTGAQVFEEKHKLAPDLLAYEVARVCDRYNRAFIVVERNNTGYATVGKLVELGYEDVLYKHIDAPTRRALDAGKISFDEALDKSQYGFPTDGMNKPLAGLALEEALRTKELGLSSQSFCDQALTVVWKDDGSFSALPGYEDDLFMALAIGWFVARTLMGNYTGFIGVMPETGHAR